MPGTHLELRGLAELERTLRGWDSALSGELRQAQAQARRLIIARLREYPPERGYKRTYALQRGWDRAVPVATSAGGLQFVNPVEYAEPVQGPDQAWMHEGYWTNIEDIAREEEGAVQDIYEAAYVRAAQTVKGR